MPTPATDEHIIQCTQCDNLYVGRLNNNGRIVPHGTTDCLQCGNDEFVAVTLADLGME